MTYEELPDGSLKRCFPPQKGVPFYSDWLEALLLRRAAFRTQRKNPRTGRWEDCILPYDRHQEQAALVLPDGSVKIICIGCTGPVDSMLVGYQSKLHSIRIKRGVTKGQSSLSHYDAQAGMHRIRIGGLVQMSLEEPCHESYNGRWVTVVEKWRRRSVSKFGWGCETCRERYHTEEASVAIENEHKTALFRAMTIVYTNRGELDKLRALKEPKPYQAWIDVLGGDLPMNDRSPERSKGAKAPDQFSAVQEVRL